MRQNWRFIGTAALALLGGGSEAWADDAAAMGAVDARISALETKIQTEESLLEKVQLEAASVLDALEAAERAQRGVDDAAAMARAAEKAAAEALMRTQRDLEATRDGVNAQLDMLAPRLRAMQRLSRDKGGSLLDSAKSLSQLLRRKRALSQVLDGDLRWMRRAQISLDELNAREKALSAAQSLHLQKLREATSREEAARAQKAALEAMHRKLLSEKALRERTLTELEKAQHNLKTYLEEMRRGAAADADGEPEPLDLFARQHRGILTFPADGFIEVGFGKIVNPKFNTVTFQSGLDIRAPKGAAVRAVTAGRVVHAAAFRGYGNLVIIDHGDGYHSLYAHLDELVCAKEDEVAPGQQVGTVGETGSLKGAYLYFELRRRGSPVDPKDWFGGGK